QPRKYEHADEAKDADDRPGCRHPGDTDGDPLLEVCVVQVRPGTCSRISLMCVTLLSQVLRAASVRRSMGDPRASPDNTRRRAACHSSGPVAMSMSSRN